jgi:hypothetical protein
MLFRCQLPVSSFGFSVLGSGFWVSFIIPKPCLGTQFSAAALLRQADADLRTW